MASFPTSAHTFTTFSNGAMSDAAQVTDIYSEVEAIEAGYLNGTARLNSSNSTVANLSVPGGSTLGGAVTLGGGVASTASFASSVTFSSGVTLNGAVVFGSSGSLTLPRSPVCKVTHDAVQQIANGAWTGVSWNTEDIDSTGMHSTATNSSRINLTSSGVWQIVAQMEFTGVAATKQMRVFLNDTDPIAAAGLIDSIDPNHLLAIGLHVATSTSDYVTVQVLLSGSTGRVNAASSGTGSHGGPRFWAYRVSA